MSRNLSSRILMGENLEKLAYITDAADTEATTIAWNEEVSRNLEAYPAIA